MYTPSVPLLDGVIVPSMPLYEVSSYVALDDYGTELEMNMISLSLVLPFPSL
jgi:hypothetical protein